MENQASLQENSAQLSMKRGLKRKAEEMNKEPDNKIEQKQRTRIHFTNEQLLHLELEFDKNNYPDIFEKEDLATKLNVKAKNVHDWFQNRRAKKRKTDGQHVPLISSSNTSSSGKENLGFNYTTTKLSEPPYIPLKCFTSQPITATRTFPLTTTPTDYPVLPSFDQLFYSSLPNSYSYSAPIKTTRPLPITTTPTLRTVLPPFNQLFSCPIYTLPPTGDTTRIR